MFIKNDNVLLKGDDLYLALQQYRVTPHVFDQLEVHIRRALRTVRALTNAEELPVAQVMCSASEIADMLILDIYPILPPSARVLPSEGIKAHIRMRLRGNEIIAIQEMIVQLVVMG